MDVHIKKYIQDNLSLHSFSAVYSHIPQDKELQETRGYMYSMIALHGPEGLQALEAINTFLDGLEQCYFSSDFVSIPVLLEKAIKEALNQLNTYFQQHAIDADISFDFCCGVINGDILYIVKIGDGVIYLIRDNTLLDLGRSLYDVSNPKIIEQGSGILLPGDSLVLANAYTDDIVSDWAVLSRYSETEIKRIFDENMNTVNNFAFITVFLEEKYQIPPEELHSEQPQNNSIIEEKFATIPESKPMKKKDIKKYLDLLIATGDWIGEQIMQWGSTIFLKVKTLFISIYEHRNEIYQRIKEFILSMKVKILNGVSSVKKGNNPISRRDLLQKLKKNNKTVVIAVTIGVVCVVVVIVGIILLIKHTEQNNQYESILDTLHKDSQAITLTTDAGTIDSLYKKDITLIQQGKSLEGNTDQLHMYLTNITTAEDQIHHIVSITNPEVITDLSLSFSGVEPSSLSLLGNELVVASPEGAFLVPTDGPSGGTRISSSLITSPIAVCSIDSTDVFLLDKDNGGVMIGSDGSVNSVAGLSDIKNIVDVASYQGNIYFLDSVDGIIYRSIAVGGGYSVATPDIQDSSLTNATSVVVDGNIFVTEPSSGIVRYFGGQTTPFMIGGLDSIGKSLGPLVFMYDSDSLANLYLLDAQNDRIVVLQKPTGTGSDTVTYQFVKQYVYAGSKNLFSHITSLTVDNAEKNMYVISGTKILKIPLS